MVWGDMMTRVVMRDLAGQEERGSFLGMGENRGRLEARGAEAEVREWKTSIVAV